MCRIFEILRNIYLFSSSCLCPVGCLSFVHQNKYYVIFRKFDTYQIAFLMTCQRHLDARKPDYKRLCILAPLKRDRRWLLGDLLINYLSLTKQRNDLLRFFLQFLCLLGYGTNTYEFFFLLLTTLETNINHTIRKCKQMAGQNTFEILLLNDANMIREH